MVVSGFSLRSADGAVTDRVYPTDLTDEQWALIEPLTPPAEPGGRPRAVNDFATSCRDTRRMAGIIVCESPGTEGRR